MRTKFTKFIAIFLFCTCILSVGFIQKASATVDYSNGWAFGITGVFDGNENTLTPASNGNYNLKDNRVLVCTGYYDGDGNIYNTIYVRVDGTFIGDQDSSNIFYDYWTNNGAYYNAMLIKNLTPGTHKIEVRTDKPFSMRYNTSVPSQKYDTITVVVPGTTNTTTSAAVTVK